MTDPLISELDQSAGYFQSVLRACGVGARPDVERVFDAYVDHKLTSARAMQRLALRHLALDLDALEGWKARVETAMDDIHLELGGLLPPDFIRVRGFARLHATLYAYLERHAGRPVAATRIRILTADQVHTERRVRELRDLGLAIATSEAGGEDTYLLDPEASDPAAGGRIQLVRNLKELTSARDDLRRAVSAALRALA
jgi:hypothetical protein